MLSRIFSLETQRKRLLRRAPDGPLRDYLSVPFPDESSEIHSVPLLSLDFETTGLDVRHDRILSIGEPDYSDFSSNRHVTLSILVNTSGGCF